MKKVMPAREVEVCDICERQATTCFTCLVCGKQPCLLCQGIVPGCMLPVDVCCECDRRSDVWAICEKYATVFAKAKDRRDAELKGLSSAGKS